MKKQNGNYLKLTLYNAKVCSGINLNSYTLKFAFGKQSNQSEKISLTDIDLGGKVINHIFNL
jgi:hypothetical protein